MRCYNPDCDHPKARHILGAGNHKCSELGCDCLMFWGEECATVWFNGQTRATRRYKLEHDATFAAASESFEAGQRAGLERAAAQKARRR